MKRGKNRFKMRYVLYIVVFIALYEIIGVCISYARHPKITDSYKEKFSAEDCYSDTVSSDRARIIEDNKDALNLRLRMFNNASNRIVISTYDFHSDRSGKDVISTLIEAAKRGVEVKILVDGFTGFIEMERNPYFYALSSCENVEIKLYNRINFFKPWKTMGRLHDKYILVDDNLYLMGGRNTFNVFLGDYGYKNYDREVLVYTGEVNEKSSIHQLEKHFNEIWNLKVCSQLKKRSIFISKENMEEAKKQLKKHYVKTINEDPQRLENLNYESFTFETNKITLLCNPTGVHAKEPRVFYSLTELMKSAKGEVKIHTPYVICNQYMYDTFAEVCKDNPNVMLMTNSVANNGNPFGASDYMKNKEKILETGIHIREYEGGVSYHGKSLTIGNELAILGSFNMDMRSTYLNTELMLVIDSKALNSQLRECMEHYEKDSVEALDDENYNAPKGVERQEIEKKQKRMLQFLRLFNWLRFLM